ncbi:MAG: DUF456 family protein [Stenomitos rutilans HA7619-LM2]|jgi:hypothetical protein|nr:DUF456 family protein [Stenomitos rutilans HA7619-LM2]
MLTLYWLLVAVMVIGIIGAVVPMIPGMSLIAIAIFIWGAVKGFSSVTIVLPLAIVLLVVSLGIDFLATYYGAKQAGVSKWGQLGAVLGLVIGILGLLPALPVGGPILGILIGPMLGAIVGEFLYRRDLKVAAKAALGIVVGSVVGNLIQGLLAIVTVAVFLWTTLPSVG